MQRYEAIVPGRMKLSIWLSQPNSATKAASAALPMAGVPKQMQCREGGLPGRPCKRRKVHSSATAPPKECPAAPLAFHLSKTSLQNKLQKQVPSMFQPD